MKESLKRIELYLRALTLLAYQQAERQDRAEENAGLTRWTKRDPNTPELQRLYSSIIKAND